MGLLEDIFRRAPRESMAVQFAPERPQEITTDLALPLKRPAILNFKGRGYPLPEEYPIYGLFSFGAGSILAAALQDNQQKLQRICGSGRKTNDSILHIAAVRSDDYWYTGAVRIDETSLSLEGRIDLDGGFYDLAELYKNQYVLAEYIVNLAAAISHYQHWNNHGLAVVENKVPAIPKAMVRVNNTLKDKRKDKSTNRIIVQGVVKHRQIRAVQLPETALLQKVRLIFPNGKKFNIAPHLKPYQLITPVVGVYTHPFEDDKIVIARLVESHSGPIPRHQVIITEAGKKEEEIGGLTFRPFSGTVYVDHFCLGESPRRVINPLQIAQYRGRGLGSIILETMENLFLKRYQAREIQFPQQFDPRKEGARTGAQFLRNNGYRGKREEFSTEHNAYLSTLVKSFSMACTFPTFSGRESHL